MCILILGVECNVIFVDKKKIKLDIDRSNRRNKMLVKKVWFSYEKL